MRQDLFGRIVCVRSPLADASGWLATVWFVAIDDDDVAVQAVRAQGAGADDELLVLGQLEPDAVRRLGLARGQAVSYP